MKWIAASIVLAGALIGLGLYFGLSARPTPPVAAPPTAPTAPSAERAAIAALESYRPGLRIACLSRDGGAQGPLRWVVDLTFDAAGVQLARGFREERGASSPEATQCLERYLPQLTIAPPGQAVRVEVPFALP